MLDGGRLGELRIFGGDGTRAGLVFLFSDAQGWDADCEQAAAALERSKLLVVGVDLSSYVDGLATSSDTCHYLVSEIEGLSKTIQRDHGFPAYVSPTLAGFGAGGTLAYAALAQAPAATIAGAAAVNPEPSLRTPVRLCEGAKVTDTGDGSFAYDPQAKLPGTWRSNAGSARTRAERLIALVADSSAGTKAHVSTGGLEVVAARRVPGGRHAARARGDLFGRRRLARHRQADRRSALGARNSGGRPRQHAELLEREVPGRRRARARRDHHAIQRGLAHRRGPSRRLLVRSVDHAVCDQPPARRRSRSRSSR